MKRTHGVSTKGGPKDCADLGAPKDRRGRRRLGTLRAEETRKSTRHESPTPLPHTLKKVDEKETPYQTRTEGHTG